MFGKLRRRAPAADAPPPQPAAPDAPRPPLAAAEAPEALIALVGQQRSLGPQLDKKALKLAALRARPLGWTNALPVAPRPGEEVPARTARTGSRPPMGAGTPPWHRTPE